MRIKEILQAEDEDGSWILELSWSLQNFFLTLLLLGLAHIQNCGSLTFSCLSKKRIFF
jgi:hypothetical protein